MYARALRCLLKYSRYGYVSDSEVALTVSSASNLLATKLLNQLSSRRHEFPISTSLHTFQPHTDIFPSAKTCGCTLTMLWTFPFLSFAAPVSVLVQQIFFSQISAVTQKLGVRVIFRSWLFFVDDSGLWYLKENSLSVRHMLDFSQVVVQQDSQTTERLQRHRRCRDKIYVQLYK